MRNEMEISRNSPSRLRPSAKGLCLTLAVGLLVVPSVPLVAQVDLGLRTGSGAIWGVTRPYALFALDQIDARNFEDLEVAWIWRADNFGPTVDYAFKSTPSYVDGMLYTVASERRQVVAIDPATGETVWIFREPNTLRFERSMRQNYGKGVTYAEVEGRGVIYITTP